MAIRVTPHTVDTICDYADGFVVHVTEADDPVAAGRALHRARPDLLHLLSSEQEEAEADGAAVSQPVLAPGGPLLRAVGLDAGDDLLERVPDIISRRLAEAGVRDALIDSPAPGGPLDRLETCANAVVLRLFPAPAGEQGIVPAHWVDLACEWVLADLAPGHTVPLRLLSIEFDVPVAEAPAIVHQACLARAWCDVVNGDLPERVRTASVTFGRAPHVALAAGGPACDSAALLARVELLRELARDLAGEVAYASIDVEPTFEHIGLGIGTAGWRAQGGASPNLVAGELCDILVPDVFPAQILGPGHLARLADEDFDGAGPADSADTDASALGAPLAAGRMEVLIGTPADWLPIYDAREDVQADGYDLLAPLLVTDAELDELLAARPVRPEVGDADAGREGVPSDMPDLDDIRLEALPHARRGLRLTFLELVSWLAHEPHSDAPRSVSPVLATYARWFASALDDTGRQALKPRARALLGTGPSADEDHGPGRGGLTPADTDRAWRATDWLARVQAATWLRAAGLVEAAGRLGTIGPTTDRAELARAAEVLGSAIVIAGRRIDLTTSLAATEREEDAHLVQQAAWDAWERASEWTGWVAASEAAGAGIPAELAYASDLRVIECARDSRLRDQLASEGTSIGDSTRSVAVHAVADLAWTAGWDAAEAVIDDRAVLSLQTALDRARRAAASRTGADDDAVEVALDAARAAATDRLTGTVAPASAADLQVHPWDAALTAAVASDGGTMWAAVHDLARGAVEEGPWDAGMQAARRAVDEVLADAPDLVDRAVAAAVAREAAGIAARGLALRAAAVARARGADPEGAVEAAHAALAPTTSELQSAALAFLDDLV